MKIRDVELDGTPLEMWEVWIATCSCGRRDIQLKNPIDKEAWCMRCMTISNVEKRIFIKNVGIIYQGLFEL